MAPLDARKPPNVCTKPIISNPGDTSKMCFFRPPFTNNSCQSATFKKTHGFPEFSRFKKIRGAAIKAASKTKATEDKSSAHLRPKRSDHEANRGAAVNSEKLRRALMRPSHFIASKKHGGKLLREAEGFSKKKLGSNKKHGPKLIC